MICYSYYWTKSVGKVKMSSFVVTAVQLSGGEYEQHIVKFRLEGMGDFAKETVISALRGGAVGRSRTSLGPLLEVVENDPPYIRSIPNGRSFDNLLSLPRF